ncbi:MAG: hypothetical protein ISR55_11945, partial [Bacteroidetes bacterium]|nr:hypothetical protein [Bacteroidota bacterium]
LHEQNIDLHISEEALSQLAEMGFDAEFGARPLKRVIQRFVLNHLSKEILAGNLKKDAKIKLVRGSDGNLEFLN